MEFISIGLKVIQMESHGINNYYQPIYYIIENVKLTKEKINEFDQYINQINPYYEDFLDEYEKLEVSKEIYNECVYKFIKNYNNKPFFYE